MKKKKDKIKINAGCNGGGGGCKQISEYDQTNCPQRDGKTNLENYKQKV